MTAEAIKKLAPSRSRLRAVSAPATPMNDANRPPIALTVKDSASATPVEKPMPPANSAVKAPTNAKTAPNPPTNVTMIPTRTPDMTCLVKMNQGKAFPDTRSVHAGRMSIDASE